MSNYQKQFQIDVYSHLLQHLFIQMDDDQWQQINSIFDLQIYFNEWILLGNVDLYKDCINCIIRDFYRFTSVTFGWNDICDVIRLPLKTFKRIAKEVATNCNMMHILVKRARTKPFERKIRKIFYFQVIKDFIKSSYVSASTLPFLKEQFDSWILNQDLSLYTNYVNEITRYHRICGNIGNCIQLEALRKISEKRFYRICELIFSILENNDVNECHNNNNKRKRKL